MADTVVTIGGDSSGLQDAFKGATKSADTMKVEAKKLTDQLREVGDEADKAAGAFVQKLGGAGAIKAIAGVGTAVGIAKAGVEAFLDSSEALFKSYGDEGQKVWDDTEKSLFAIKGAFAEAVLGGGSMEEMGKRLKGIFEGTKVVVDTLLTPVKLLAQAFWGASDAATASAKGLKDYNDAVERQATQSAAAKQNVEEYTKLIWSLTGQTDKLTQATNNAARADGMKRLAAIAAQEAEADHSNAMSQVAAMQLRNEASALEALNTAKRISNRAWSGTEEDAFLKAAIAGMNQDVYDRARERLSGFSKARAEEANRITESMAQLDAFEAKQAAVAAAPTVTPTFRSTPAATGDTAPPDPEVYARVYMEGLMQLSKEQADAIQASEIAYGESSTTILTMKQSELDKMLAMQEEGHRQGEAAKKASDARKAAASDAYWAKEKADEEARAAAKKAADEAEAAREIALAKQVADAKKAEMAKLGADLYVLAVNNSAKMLAVDLQDKEKSKTAAQRATAAVVSGLGDMAMIKSGLAAAAGNFGEAAAFSAVGTLAYAAAAKLAPSEKTKTTAPAAAVAGPSTTNVAYNLRVDAAFADGESVARRFAEMQQGAQRRGLI
jgi:hypothetical protein